MSANPMSTNRAGSGGFTLLEVLFSVTLLGVVSAAVVGIAPVGAGVYRQTMIGASLEDRAGEVVRQMRARMRLVSRADVLSMDESPSWHAEAKLGYLGGVSQWDGTSQIRTIAVLFQREPDEADDGVDNNGNGLVDEGMVVLMEEVGGGQVLTTVLCRGVTEYAEGEVENGIDDNGNGLVDESGFCIERKGGALVLHLTLSRTYGGSRVQTHSISVALAARN